MRNVLGWIVAVVVALAVLVVCVILAAELSGNTYVIGAGVGMGLTAGFVGGMKLRDLILGRKPDAPP